MNTIFEQTPPRSGPELDGVMAPLVRRTRTSARLIVGAFLALAAIVSGFMIAASLSGTHEDLVDAAKMSAVVAVYLGLLPAWAVRRIIHRDLRLAPALVREGAVFRAREAGGGSYGGRRRYVDVLWDESGHEAGARFETGRFAAPIETPEQIVVYAKPGDKWVACILGDNGLYVGRRWSPRR